MQQCTSHSFKEVRRVATSIVNHKNLIRKDVRHLPPMQNQKWEEGWTLLSTAWIRMQSAWAESPAAAHTPWFHPALKPGGSPARWRRSSCTHSHYPPPMPPTPDTLGFGCSPRPRLPPLHGKSPVLGYSKVHPYDTPCGCWSSRSPKSRCRN